MKNHKTRDTAVSSGIEKKIIPLEQHETTLKAVFYGRAGTGKTTLAASFPAPILLMDVNDKGTDSVSDVKGIKLLQCNEWIDFEQAYWYIKKNPGKFKTIVIDTVSQLQDLAMKQVMEDGKKEPGSLLSRKDWGEISSMVKTWLINYRDLPENIVFIAQDRIFNGGEDNSDTDGQIMPEVGPRLMPSIAATLNAAVSVIGNTFIREKVKKIKTAEKKIIEKKTIEYCLRIGPHAYYTTKVRKPKAIEVPSFIVDPSYKKLVANFTEGDE